MKISVVIQYYNRRNLLINTLNSIKESLVKKSNIEIVIVDDASDDSHYIDDIESLYPDFDIKIHSYKKEEKWWFCPVIPINKGISMATGDVIVMLCAECMFIGDILKDIIYRIKPNDYLVYATLAISKEDTEKISEVSYKYLLNNRFDGEWYQHSKHRNVCYNFCSAILKDDLLDLGGFDERYAGGADYGDNDFVWRIKKKNMNIISIDEPLTYHQNHSGMLYDNFNKQVDSGDVNNFTGLYLYEHVLENEINKSYKVRNSYLIDENFIFTKPELESALEYTKSNLYIKNENNTVFVEFFCNVPGLKINIDIFDYVENEIVPILSTELSPSSWISQNFTSSVILKASFRGNVIYQNHITDGFEFNHSYNIPVNIFRPVNILSYND